MITIERHLAIVREAGIDPDEVENTLKACKCGMPQVIADINIVNGRVVTYARCTETDRKVCRVSKRLRIYKGAVPGTAADPTDPEAVAEQAVAEEMANAMVDAMEEGATAEEAASAARATLTKADAMTEAAEAAEEDDEDSEEW